MPDYIIKIPLPKQKTQQKTHAAYNIHYRQNSIHISHYLPNIQHRNGITKKKKSNSLCYVHLIRMLTFFDLPCTSIKINHTLCYIPITLTNEDKKRKDQNIHSKSRQSFGNRGYALQYHIIESKLLGSHHMPGCT